MKLITIFLFAFFTLLGSVYAGPRHNLVTKSVSLVGSRQDDQLKQVHKMLAQADGLAGHFKQVRKIKLLAAPLVSSGRFVLSKAQGLKWQQTSPFKSNLIVTGEKIEQQLENSPKLVITKEQQPVVFSFTNIFLSVFNGDTKAISEYFTITFTGNTAHWNIILKPIAAPMNKAIESIAMSGGKYINCITINEVKNNQIIIQLFNVKEL